MSNRSSQPDPLVITAAKICLDKDIDVLWPNPDKPGKFCHLLVSTYRPEQLEPPLDNSLETLASLCREVAERDGRMDVTIHLSAQPLYESVGFWRKSQRIRDVVHVARLILNFKAFASSSPAVDKQETIAIATELVDAWHDRL